MNAGFSAARSYADMAEYVMPVAQMELPYSPGKAALYDVLLGEPRQRPPPQLAAHGGRWQVSGVQGVMGQAEARYGCQLAGCRLAHLWRADWRQASAFCQALGGDLLSYANDLERDRVADMLAEWARLSTAETVLGVWIGAVRAGGLRTFYFTDGAEIMVRDNEFFGKRALMLDLIVESL